MTEKFCPVLTSELTLPTVLVFILKQFQDILRTLCVLNLLIVKSFCVCAENKCEYAGMYDCQCILQICAVIGMNKTVMCIRFVKITIQFKSCVCCPR